MTTWRNPAPRFGVAALAIVGLCLAGHKDKQQPADPPPKPSVDVVTLHAQPVALAIDLPGRTSAYRTAKVRPQVNGIILKRNVWRQMHHAVPERETEHNTIFIHGTSQVVLNTLDSDEDLVEVPLVPGAWRAAAHVVRETPSEFLAPVSHRLVGDNNAAFSREQLDIPQACAEDVV